MPLSKNISVFLSLNTKQFQSGIAKATTRMKAFSASMKSIGASITTNFTMPFALLGGYSAKLALDFDKSMTKIRTLVGISGKEVARFADSVKDLSTKTGIGATELADALFDLTSAGLRGDDALKALEMAAKASAVGLGETKAIAGALSGVLNAYADSNLDAATATDILLKTVREGKLEAESLAPVLGRVTPLAATLGVSFEEVGASIATFTRLGVSAEEAATGLRGVMSALIKPTSQARLALKSYGTSIEEVKKMVGERGLMLTLKHLMETFGDNDQAISSLFGNVRALTTVLGTAGTQAETYEDVLNSLTDSTGALNEAFGIVEETSSFKLNTAWQTLKDSLIELGEALVPIILQFSNWLKGMTEKWKKLNPETKKWITQLTVAFAIGGPILMGVGSLAGGLTRAASAMASFVLYNPKLALLAAAVALIAYYWDDVKIALANASNTFIDFYNNTIEFRALIWGVAGVLAQMVGLVILIFDTMVATITYLGKKVEAVISDTVGSLGGFLSGDVGVVDMAYKAFVTGNPFGAAADALGLGDALGMEAGGHPLLNPAGDDDPSITSKDFWDDEVNFAESALTAIDDFWKQSENIWGTVKDNVNEGKISAVVTPEMIQEPFDNVADGIKNALGSVFGDIAGWLGMDGEMDAFGGGFGGDGEEGNLLDVVLSDEDIEEKKTKFQEFIDGVKTSWGEGMTIMAQEFDAFATRFGDGMADALSTAIVEGESMKEAFKGFMKNMTQEVLKMIIKTLLLRTVMKALGLPVAPMNLGAGLDSMAGITDVGDVAFGPAQGRYIIGPEGAFSLNPRDSIVAGTNLFGGGSQGGDSMTVNGYISGSSIMLSNERETNTTNRLS